MKRMIWPVLALPLVLMLPACTDSPDAPDAAASASPSPTSTAPSSPSGGSPGEPTDGTSTGTPQQLLDAAVDALYASPSVKVQTAERAPLPPDITFRTGTKAIWFPEDDAWLGTQFSAYRPRPKWPGGRQRVLWIDGRAYLQFDLDEPGRAVWYTDKQFAALDIGKGWPFGSTLPAIEATSATEDGRTTTIIGEVPNKVALRQLGLIDQVEGDAYDDELYPGSTLVTLVVANGYPKRFSLYGRDIGLPAHGVSPEFMAQLAATDAVIRYEEGTRTKPLRPPPPDRVEPAGQPIPGEDG